MTMTVMTAEERDEWMVVTAQLTGRLPYFTSRQALHTWRAVKGWIRLWTGA